MIRVYLMVPRLNQQKQGRNALGQFISYKVPVPAKPTPAIEKNPLAFFYYPMSDQPWNSRRCTVRVISANKDDLIGLESKLDGTWQFKHFKQSKISEFTMEYAPQSMPVYRRR